MTIIIKRVEHFDHRADRKQYVEANPDDWELIILAAEDLTCEGKKVSKRAVTNKTKLKYHLVSHLFPLLNEKSERLMLRLSPLEKMAIKYKAAKSEKTMTDLVVQSIFRAVIVALPKKELNEHNKWLNYINSNLNMISRHCNTWREKVLATQILAGLIGIKREIDEQSQTMRDHHNRELL